MMNAIIALRCLGYSTDDPQVIRALDEFEKLGIEEEETFRMQPCVSPVWDTAYALFALAEAGVPAQDGRMIKCADWILQKQVRTTGDWKVKNQQGQPGGWYFEFNNEFYPDVDDTAQVCLALSRVYTFGPTFRAEKSTTTRHLAEFWMIEPEIAFADLKDDADLAEDFLKCLIRTVLEEQADVLAPCALGAILNTRSIARLRVPVIAGAANNQLARDADGEALRAAGILYAPDYVINAGGIISVAREYYGGTEAQVVEDIHGIPARLTEIFERARHESRTTNEVADRIARERLGRGRESPRLVA
jgi:hypothetical protein